MKNLFIIAFVLLSVNVFAQDKKVTITNNYTEDLNNIEIGTQSSTPGYPRIIGTGISVPWGVGNVYTMTPAGSSTTKFPFSYIGSAHFSWTICTSTFPSSCTSITATDAFNTYGVDQVYEKIKFSVGSQTGFIQNGIGTFTDPNFLWKLVVTQSTGTPKRTNIVLSSYP
ncbi:MAG: hypothetical protein PSV16_05535 [Flavobacterium sp.]|nr:hypothetical protein [Flavobacterium sp.]